MSHVAVQKIDPDEASLMEDMQALTDRIRLRAYELFQSRGGGDGAALDDWLTAENDLVLTCINQSKGVWAWRDARQPWSIELSRRALEYSRRAYEHAREAHNEGKS
jgi:hypothetical protein